MNIREKILVIEDEKSIAHFISTILTANGYEAMRASKYPMRGENSSRQGFACQAAAHCPCSRATHIWVTPHPGHRKPVSQRKRQGTGWPIAHRT